MSGRPKEGFEAHPEVRTVLMALEQTQLIDKDGAQGKTLGGHQAARGDLLMPVKDALELLVEVLDGHRARLVQDAADLDPRVSVWIRATRGGDQHAAAPHTQVLQGGIAVVL